MWSSIIVPRIYASAWLSIQAATALALTGVELDLLTLLFLRYDGLPMPFNVFVYFVMHCLSLVLRSLRDGGMAEVASLTQGIRPHVHFGNPLSNGLLLRFDLRYGLNGMVVAATSVVQFVACILLWVSVNELKSVASSTSIFFLCLLVLYNLVELAMEILRLVVCITGSGQAFLQPLAGKERLLIHEDPLGQLLSFTNPLRDVLVTWGNNGPSGAMRISQSGNEDEEEIMFK